MAFLFQIKEKIVYPNEETLIIYPFKEIWKRDKSKNKEIALQEFAYIEFMSSQKKTNPFRGYSDKIKEDKVIEEVIKTEGWKPDELVKEGINYWIRYQQEASATYSYYMSVKKAAEELQNFFTTVDLSVLNDKGVPVYKAREITSALKDTGKILEELNNLEKKVQEELFEDSKKKGNQKISFFSTPESLK